MVRGQRTGGGRGGRPAAWRPLAIFVVGALLALLALPSQAAAEPWMSLTAGTPCSACHVNNQGGGMRTEIGWGATSRVGAFGYDDLGLEALHELDSNLLADDLIGLGADIRVQIARLGRPSVSLGSGDTTTIVEPERVVFPMQIQPYLAVFATDWLTLYGSYAPGQPITDGELCDPTYEGQSCFVAMGILKPATGWPTFRVGMIQPSIGIRHDDHTYLLRADAARPRNPIIPPNYAELGAELSYQPVYWFQTDAGVFRVSNLAESLTNPDAVVGGDIGYLGRVSFQPQLAELKLTTMIGTSLYGAGGFQLENYFVGLGRKGLAALFLEMSRSRQGTDEVPYDTLALAAQLTVELENWLIFQGRVEQATTDRRGEEFITNQYVAGFQIYPIPYLELRPEYRLLSTPEYILGQYTMQFHLYF